MWPYAIPAIISGVGKYLGGRAGKKGMQKAYQRAYQRLLDNQRIQNEALGKKLDYQTGLAYRGIGDTAAVTGMTGAPIAYRSQGVANERGQIEEQNAYQQQIERLELEGRQAEADILRKSQAKSDLYNQAGGVAGGIFSAYANQPKQIEPYVAPKINYTPPDTFYEGMKEPILSNIGKLYKRDPYAGLQNPYAGLQKSPYNLYPLSSSW